jgi:hypothetical protein
MQATGQNAAPVTIALRQSTAAEERDLAAVVDDWIEQFPNAAQHLSRGSVVSCDDGIVVVKLDTPAVLDHLDTDAWRYRLLVALNAHRAKRKAGEINRVQFISNVQEKSHAA